MERMMDQGMPERDDPIDAIYLADGDPVSGSHVALLSAHISRLAGQIAALTEAVSSLAARVEQPPAPQPVVQRVVVQPEPKPEPVRIPEPLPQPAPRPAPAPVTTRPFRSALDTVDDWPSDADLEEFSARQRAGRDDIW